MVGWRVEKGVILSAPKKHPCYVQWRDDKGRRRKRRGWRGVCTKGMGGMQIENI